MVGTPVFAGFSMLVCWCGAFRGQSLGGSGGNFNPAVSVSGCQLKGPGTAARSATVLCSCSAAGRFPGSAASSDHLWSADAFKGGHGIWYLLCRDV